MFQGGASKDWYHELGQRYGFEPNLSEAGLQQRLEEMRENLKKEIRKEMKIKEGAEKLREVSTDKKSLSNVSSIVKKANNKLQELQHELQELNAYLLVSNSGDLRRDSLQGEWAAKSSGQIQQRPICLFLSNNCAGVRQVLLKRRFSLVLKIYGNYWKGS